ncbi:MAG: serine/threonine protein kinase [Alphaproteobacteria bacterium]|nr:serine/threonine protein kinase [Alphaproteobacteria bacterium]MCB9696744.1 serine/threonine protein kinase [Alphaproteobacteria bacterium]
MRGALLDDRYQVSAVLGGGGSSVVYLAHHSTLRREVAIKVVRPELFESEADLDHYLEEARIVASLDHPNIVTIFDVGRLPDSRPYMVMEHVAGRSLSRLLEGDGALPIDIALDLFEQMAAALGHAHRHGVVHRDIKPANILIRQRSTGRAVAKLADFGIASVSRDRHGHPAAFVGTPHYMSPEQAAGRPVVPASDLYSLGVVMYRALTGFRAFDGDSPDDLARSHLEDRPKPLREVAPDCEIPESLERVVMKCLQKDPSRRYAQADDLLVDLLEARRAMAQDPRFSLASYRSQESLEPVRVVEVQRPPEPMPRRVVWMAAAALVLTFGGGLLLGALLM